MAKQNLVCKNNFLITLLAASSFLLSTGISPVKAQSKQLKIGVVDGVLPCSGTLSGKWDGIALNLWDLVAKNTHQQYQLVPQKTTADMLEETKKGNIDLGIGCVSLSPKRINQYSFTVPFREDGVAVLSRVKSFDVGSAMAKSLFSQYLLTLVIGFIIVMSILSGVLFLIEKKKGASSSVKQEDTFKYLFKSIAAQAMGPGCNSFADTKPGNTLLIVIHLIRLVFASLIVSYITVNVVKQNQSVSDQKITKPIDLAGLRIAVRQGSISNDFLKDTNQELTSHGQPGIQIVSSPTLNDAFKLLIDSKVDAMMGDNAQLQYLKRNSKISSSLAIGLQDTLIQSQGFTISPNIPLQTRMAINFVIADLKQKGNIEIITKEWLGDDGLDQSKSK
jgi:polar amino acid transport system substrate-binding protein